MITYMSNFETDLSTCMGDGRFITRSCKIGYVEVGINFLR